MIGVVNVLKIITVALVIFLLGGCTTCKQKVISTVVQEQWSADLRYTVCDSYSGYDVVIYQTGDAPGGPSAWGSAEKGSFRTAFRGRGGMPDSHPVTMSWIGRQQLLVTHETASNQIESETKDVVFKADKLFDAVTVNYRPEPVIWDLNY